MQDEAVWRPDEGAFRDSNTGRLAHSLGISGGYDELHAASIADLDGFWDAVVADLGIPFSRPYTQVLDESGGPEWPRWFAGGRLNLASACVERFADDPASAGREAVVWEGEEGTTRSWTYASSARGRAAGRGPRGSRRRRRATPSRCCCRWCPRPWRVLRRRLARRALVPIFSGFSAPAVASRLQDSGASVLITCDACPRAVVPSR